MKVYLERNPALHFDCELQEGQTGQVADDLGRKLVAAGIAKCLDPPKSKKQIEAVPEQPEIAESKQPAVGGKSKPADTPKPASKTK